jgi:hypothetical protein
MVKTHQCGSLDGFYTKRGKTEGNKIQYTKIKSKWLNMFSRVTLCRNSKPSYRGILSRVRQGDPHKTIRWLKHRMCHALEKSGLLIFCLGPLHGFYVIQDSEIIIESKKALINHNYMSKSWKCHKETDWDFFLRHWV